MLKANQVYFMESIEGLRKLDSLSVDLVLCDLPYNITRNRWDSLIDPETLFGEYTRVIKEHGAIILFGSGMFTAQMMMGGKKLWRYNLVWEKNLPTGFLNSGRMPLRIHEDIMVFYKKLPTYHPQKTTGHTRKTTKAIHKEKCRQTTNYNHCNHIDYDSTERYPTSVLHFPTDKHILALHPTQKPLELCRYLIRTYSTAEDLVVDNTCGSGTTCLAALLEGRRYIGFDNGYCEDSQSENYQKSWAEIATNRLKLME